MVVWLTLAEKVCSVIVAYNDLDDFKVLLKKVGEQNFKCTKVIVIDNSDDDNKNYIKNECKNFTDDYKIPISYYESKKNLGSALGFSLGMQLSMKENIDWVWLHDQDGYPDNNCLFNLIENSRNSETYIIAPAVYDINNNYLDYFRCKNNCFLNGVGANNKKQKEFIDVFGTAGVLIHKDVIKNIGPYDGENFFVGYEDIEYSFRCLSKGYKVLLLNNAVYRHPDLAEKYKYKRKDSIFKYIKPVNFSHIKNNDSFRSKKSVYSASYNFYKYSSKKVYLLNYIYSMSRTIVSKIFHNEVNIKETFKLYNEGIKAAKSNVSQMGHRSISSYISKIEL